MLGSQPRDRLLPTLATLVVLGLLMMTIHVRLEGGGVVGVVRSGTRTVLGPVQEAAAIVAGPIADVVDSLSNVAALREENDALRAENAELFASITALQDQTARLELLENFYQLESSGEEIGRTLANVISRTDPFDAALTINKGTADGIVRGQPVVNTTGFVAGVVDVVGRSTSTVVPITANRQALTVVVGEQIGTLHSVPGSDLMRLQMPDAREPVMEGDQVLTSAVSVNFPAGLPVGEIVEDAAPLVDLLNTRVDPFVDPDTLRFVVVLAWPPDPISVTLDDDVAEGRESAAATSVFGLIDSRSQRVRGG